MQTNPTTRRALLTGGARVAAYAAGAAIVGGAVAVADAKGATVERSAWDKAFAQMKAARAASEANDRIHDKIYDAWKAQHPSEETIDWQEFRFHDRWDVKAVIDLDRYEAEILAAEGKTWWGTAQAKARRIAAVQSVRDYRAAVAANDKRHGIDEACERNDRLGFLRCDAEWALLLTPAPDGNALLWKLEHLFGPDSVGPNDTSSPSWQIDGVNAFMADARRLLAREA